LNAGAWLRRVRFVIISPVPRHHRRVQAEIPLIPVFEFGQPPLTLNTGAIGTSAPVKSYVCR
jgi:hypothetical protein